MVCSYRSRFGDNLIAATVRVLTLDGGNSTVESGTGWFVAPGYVVTCAHVVPAGHRYQVVYLGKPVDADVLVRRPPVGAEVVFAYPDVALLEVDVPDHPSIPLTTTKPRQGDTLYAYGCPVVNTVPMWNHMTMTVEGDQFRDGTTDLFIKTKGGQVRPGASGSGAIDESGALVGMVVQTRDARLDLGGALVPTEAILDTLAAAGHDLAAANEAATTNFDTLAGAERRLNWVLQVLADDLTTVAAPTHWASMLRKMDGRPPRTPLDVRLVALALLGLELDDLGDAIAALAMASRRPDVSRLLPTAASFAWFDGRPLVEPDTAVQLAIERRQTRPRVVHLPVSCERSVYLHTGRAAVDDRWEVVPLTGPYADTDDTTGLPGHLLRAIRLQMLDEIGVEPDPDDLDRAWTEHGPRAKIRAGGRLVFALSADGADVDLVTALRQEFAPAVFVLAGRSLSRALHGTSALLALPEARDDAGEQHADERYHQVSRMIERVLE